MLLPIITILLYIVASYFLYKAGRKHGHIQVMEIVKRTLIEEGYNGTEKFFDTLDKYLTEIRKLK